MTSRRFLRPADRQTERESRERRASPLQDQHALVRTLTCAVTHALVSDDVLVLQRSQDLDFPLEVAQVLGRAVLQLLDGDDLARVVLQRVVAALLHAAEVPLQTDGSNEG